MFQDGFIAPTVHPREASLASLGGVKDGVGLDVEDEVAKAALAVVEDLVFFEVVFFNELGPNFGLAAEPLLQRNRLGLAFLKTEEGTNLRPDMLPAKDVSVRDVEGPRLFLLEGPLNRLRQHVAIRDIDEDLVGFWRPGKLHRDAEFFAEGPVDTDEVGEIHRAPHRISDDDVGADGGVTKAVFFRAFFDKFLVIKIEIGREVTGVVFLGRGFVDSEMGPIDFSALHENHVLEGERLLF